MSDRPPIPLRPVLIDPTDPQYQIVLGWPFVGPDAYVGRLLREDVPQSVRFKQGQVWIYSDPDGQLVGSGVVDVCEEYSRLTGGLPHPYLRLLAVNPTIRSLGFGTSIVQHLIGQAAVFVRRGGCAAECTSTSTRPIRGGSTSTKSSASRGLATNQRPTH